MTSDFDSLSFWPVLLNYLECTANVSVNFYEYNQNRLVVSNHYWYEDYVDNI